MRGIRVIFCQQFVETMLRIFRQRIRQLDSETAETRCPNRNQQRCDSLALFVQVSQACLD